MGRPLTAPVPRPSDPRQSDPRQTAHIRIDHYSAVHLAAETARSVARACRLPGSMPDQAAVVASELASNLAKHATNGALFLHPLPLGAGVEILAADRGPGIPDLSRSLTDGYTTTNTLGTGLGAVRRISTSFTIRSRTGVGTLACARLVPPDPRDPPPGQPPAGPDVGAVCLAAEGERTSGDAYAVIDTDGVRTAIVVDGLGHGPGAAEPAHAALRAFGRTPDSPLPEILTAVHRALRHTRGTALGLLRLHPGRAEYCGVGNVRALALGHDSVHHRLTGQPGVAGLNVRSARVHRIPLEPGSTAVLHTDGIDQRWAHAPSPFLLRLPPTLLPAALAHGHRLSRDDATVLATTPPQRLP
ncbi:SpoIIE family protein phosphatase [Streptomyces sp. NBC_01429]|uniref:SpoIIE family protein phosphatase n=1 Tax=Streptomyces sp. NBC_01429 TaxID=2903862 RepID=UPI002E2C9F8D|nr:SpoIIE family protein phosphatase [Streptomyces sp. NBC_01429]